MLNATDKPMDRSPPRISRGGWLDVLRFVVASMIVIYHFRMAAPLPLPELHPVFERGYLLTNFFIIDSGYVLGRIYSEKLAARALPLGDFYRQRFLRVVPAHLIVSLALAALILSAAAVGISPSHPEWFSWSEFPAQFFLVQSYGVPGGEGWNAPTWTLSALLGCYLCLPLLSRIGHRISPWSALAASVTILLATNLVTQAWLGLPVYEMPLRFGFLRALPLFALGVGVAIFASRVYVSPLFASWLGIGALFLLAIAQAFGHFALASLGLMTVIIFAAGAVPVRRSSKLVEHLAMMSFSIFLTNEVVRIVWFGVFDVAGQTGWPTAIKWSVWGCGLLAALIGAAVFRYMFDRPSQKWLGALIRRIDGKRSAGIIVTGST